MKRKNVAVLLGNNNKMAEISHRVVKKTLPKNTRREGQNRKRAGRVADQNDPVVSMLRFWNTDSTKYMKK